MFLHEVQALTSLFFPAEGCFGRKQTSYKLLKDLYSPQQVFDAVCACVCARRRCCCSDATHFNSFFFLAVFSDAIPLKMCCVSRTVDCCSVCVPTLHLSVLKTSAAFMDRCTGGLLEVSAHYSCRESIYHNQWLVRKLHHSVFKDCRAGCWTKRMYFYFVLHSGAIFSPFGIDQCYWFLSAAFSMFGLWIHVHATHVQMIAQISVHQTR